jgi:hypothetical protein
MASYQSSGCPSLKKRPLVAGPALSTPHITESAPCSGVLGALLPPMSVLQQAGATGGPVGGGGRVRNAAALLVAPSSSRQQDAI